MSVFVTEGGEGGEEGVEGEKQANKGEEEGGKEGRSCVAVVWIEWGMAAKEAEDSGHWERSLGRVLEIQWCHILH